MEINKKQLRQTMIAVRDQQRHDDIRLKSQRIFEIICNHPTYINSRTIFSYMSFRSEVDTSWFHKKVLEDHKILALPRVMTKKEMVFYKVQDFNQLKPGPMGILEPNETCVRISDYEDVSLMIVPGVAFDSAFGRLGYGGGYYDRYLEKYAKHFICCGVAFECQWVDQVPRMPYDRLMDMIVTEEKWLERMDVK